MEKEERKELEKEYKEFATKKYYGKELSLPIYFSIIASAIVFILPKDILSQYSFLRYFTEFMRNIFPNISIFAQRSKAPELTEFYFSYMWLVAIVMIGLIIFAIPKTNEEAKKYFGTGEYKGKGIFPYKFVSVMQSFFNTKYLLYYLGIILMFGYAVYSDYTGSLIEGGISRLRFGEAISTRFGMFFIGNVFQNLSLYVILMTNIMTVLNTIHIQKIKKGE